MKTLVHILSFFLFSWALGVMPARSQVNELPVSCAGSKVRYGTAGMPNSVFNWEVTGGTIIANYNDSIDVQWNDAATVIRSLTVLELTEQGCYGQVEMANVLVRKPVITLGGTHEICADGTFEFDAGGGFNQYLWQDGTSTRNYVANQPGTYSVRVIDDAGCVATDSAELVVHALPEVDLGPDVSWCGPGGYALDAGNAGSLFRWSTDEQSQFILVYEGPQEYWVEVTNNHGCVAKDTMRILVCTDGSQLIDVPNAFTPNDDGDNDVWLIGRISKYPDATVFLYDRWGRLVYSATSGYNEPWDGRSNGVDMPMDAYYYVIDLNIGASQIVGSVTLIR